jgi:hypothetical protein
MTSKRLAVVDAVLKRFRIGLGYASELGVMEGDKDGYMWQTQPHITTATRIGDTFMAVDDSDTDDSTVNIAITDCRDILMKGTAINRWHVFNFDATSLVAGTVVFVFRNWSSEIRGVRNSDSTLWLRIMPSQTAVVFLTAGGTAAGTWGAELSQIHPDYGFENIEDFVWGTAVSTSAKSGISGAASGTGAVAGVMSSDGVASGGRYGVSGIGRLSAGTDTTGRAYFVWYGRHYANGTMPFRFFVNKGRIGVAADVTADFVLDIGWSDKYSAVGDPDNGALLRYDRANHATNWRTVVAGGASVTADDTATAVPIATLFDLNMELASDSGRFDVWMDRVLIATVTGANIPNGGTEFLVTTMKIDNTAGTANDRLFTMDACGIMGAKNKRRGEA